MLRNDFTDVEQRFQLTLGVIGNRGRSSLRRRKRGVRHRARIALRGEWLNRCGKVGKVAVHAAGLRARLQTLLCEQVSMARVLAWRECARGRVRKVCDRDRSWNPHRIWPRSGFEEYKERRTFQEW